MNCKPGDLAIVIGSHPVHAETIGRIVTVISPSMYDGEWIIEFYGNRPKCLWPDLEVLCRDDKLRPVSGLPMKYEVTKEDKEPA